MHTHVATFPVADICSNAVGASVAYMSDGPPPQRTVISKRLSMKPATIWVARIIAVGLAFFVIGVVVGERIEQNRFEVAKAFATTQADEYLAAGNADKAISALYLAKAFEPQALDGSTDGRLGKAYQAKGRPCMAESFLESNVGFIERNGLTGTSESYGPTKQLLAAASKTCAAMRQSRQQ